MRPAMALTLVLSFGSLARAQSTHASLAGHVTDPSRAVIVNAMVTAVNTETSVRHETTTNDAGQYYVTNLPPGAYRIEIEKPGFKTLIKPAVTLHVQDALTIDLEMSLGQVSEAITVEGGAPIVDTRSGTVRPLPVHAKVRSASCCCSSRPLSPGSDTSSTRQQGTVARGRDRNSRGDANVSGFQPALLISSSSDSRTEMSSSTTKTMGETSGMARTPILPAAVEGLPVYPRAYAPVPRATVSANIVVTPNSSQARR
jgi:Carboxypeptidase regulatory-like domain